MVGSELVLSVVVEALFCILSAWMGWFSFIRHLLVYLLIYICVCVCMERGRGRERVYSFSHGTHDIISYSTC